VAELAWSHGEQYLAVRSDAHPHVVWVVERAAAAVAASRPAAPVDSSAVAPSDAGATAAPPAELAPRSIGEAPRATRARARAVSALPPSVEGVPGLVAAVVLASPVRSLAWDGAHARLLVACGSPRLYVWEPSGVFFVELEDSFAIHRVFATPGGPVVLASLKEWRVGMPLASE
jgi:hypothetical protein